MKWRSFIESAIGRNFILSQPSSASNIQDGACTACYFVEARMSERCPPLGTLRYRGFLLYYEDMIDHCS